MKLYRFATENVNSILVVAKNMRHALGWMDREHPTEEVVYARKLQDNVNVTDNGGVMDMDQFTEEDLKVGGTD